MGAIDKKTLAVAKSYTNESLLGGGAVVGKNVTISSITPIDGGNRVTFSYTLDNGTQKTSTMDVMDGIDGKDGASGSPGQNGISITGIAKTSTDGLTDTYTMTFSDGSTFDYEVKNGQQGIQGLRGEKGNTGDQGQPGLQGVPGERGKDGYPFLIYKEYDDLSDFDAADFPEVGLMFMIKEQDENNSFPVYRYTGDENELYSYITGLSTGETIKGDKGDPGDPGAQGVPGQAGKDGTTYVPVIGTVTSGTQAAASVATDDDTKTAEFSFVLPKGDKGDTGQKGDQGDPGLSPTLGENGNWWYGNVDSGIPAFPLDDILKYIDKTYGIQDTPIGHILTHMGKSAPEHYLVCDGTVYLVADYPYLAQHFSDEFGASNCFGGNGTTTFAVPDLRGEFLRGSGTNSRSGQGSGGTVGAHQNATVHNAVNLGGSSNTYLIQTYQDGNYRTPQNVDSSTMANRWSNVNSSSNNAGSAVSTYTSRPTNTSVLYCIKCEPTYFLKIDVTQQPVS